MIKDEYMFDRLKYVMSHNESNHPPFVSPEHGLGCLVCEMQDLVNVINAPRDGEIFGNQILHRFPANFMGSLPEQPLVLRHQPVDDIFFITRKGN